MSRPSTPLTLLLMVGLAALVAAAGGAIAEPNARAELAKAQARGKELFEQTWGEGTKSCLECHARGANKLSGTRLKTYPKFDRGLGGVVTGQAKLRQMILERSGAGEAPELGSEELTALEAYVATLR